MSSLAILLRLTAGVACAGLALVGFVLPVLPGWVFLGAAVVLLFPGHPASRKMFAVVDRHMPRVARLLERLHVHRRAEM